MPQTTTNLGLTIWTADNDIFDYGVLARNFQAIDARFSSTSVSTTPIRFIESLSAVPLTNLTDGRLVYLTAADSGFSANTIIQYRTNAWYEISQPELVTTVPTQNNYTGRIVVFTTNSSPFVQGDVAVYNGSAYVRVNKGVNTYATAALAKADNSTSGNLVVITAADATLGTGGPFGAYSLAVYNAALGNYSPIAGVPPGAIEMYAGATNPTGWLLCDGSTYNKTDYPNLNTVLSAASYPYGSASTTFNVPDFRGRVPVGLGTNASVNALGTNEGNGVANRRPHHRTSLTDPGHYHPYGDGASGSTAGSGSTGNIKDPTTYSHPTATTGITVGTNNSNDALDTPSFIVINYIIKV